PVRPDHRDRPRQCLLRQGPRAAGSDLAVGRLSRRMNLPISRLIASWRTGLPRPVLILQAGNALNYFGYGLILPFEIIYLHQIRGFSTSISGTVHAASLLPAAVATPPTRALLDRYFAKAIVDSG